MSTRGGTAIAHISDRNLMERPDLEDPEVDRGGIGRLVYVILGTILSAVLFWGAVTLVTGWHAWIVLGAVVWTLIGFMIAISPKRPW